MHIYNGGPLKVEEYRYGIASEILRDTTQVPH